MLQIDENAANAVMAIVNQMPNEFVLVEDYLARSLVLARDQMENGSSKERDEKAGVCQGLRGALELRRRAISRVTQEPMNRSKDIIGESEYLIDHKPHEV